MKTYKGWEILRMISDDRLKEDQKLIDDHLIHYIIKKYDGDLILDYQICCGHPASITLQFRTFTLMQEPITFMEAAKALANGKKVRCEVGIEICHYENSLLDDENNEPVSTNEVLDGKWFVEENKYE